MFYHFCYMKSKYIKYKRQMYFILFRSKRVVIPVIPVIILSVPFLSPLVLSYFSLISLSLTHTYVFAFFLDNFLPLLYYLVRYVYECPYVFYNCLTCITKLDKMLEIINWKTVSIFINEIAQNYKYPTLNTNYNISVEIKVLLHLS